MASSGSRRHSPPRASRRRTASTGSKLLGSPPYTPHAPSQGKAWGLPRPGPQPSSGKACGEHGLCAPPWNLFSYKIHLRKCLRCGDPSLSFRASLMATRALNATSVPHILSKEHSCWFKKPLSRLGAVRSPMYAEEQHQYIYIPHIFWIFFCRRSITVEPCFQKRLPS